ncbi:MAG: glyoxylate/hydroxypyruvate reductase A [Devosiaceae bacterium]|nr:glyoxylate/hydroxypyruvate reductase A [Devosiaceae bacterium]
MALLLHLNNVDEEQWAKSLGKKLGNYPIVGQGDNYNPSDIKYIFVWKPDEGAFDGLDNLKAILCLGAGVDALLEHRSLPKDVPITRFIDDELAQCMSDYVVANVTMHHRLFCRYQSDKQNKTWSQFFPPPANERNVGIMGLGELGKDAITKLKPLGFNLLGFSRSKKQIAGVKTFAGKQEFDDFLRQSEILVNLLPLTNETKHILNYDNFKKLKRSKHFVPVIINAARGGHQIESDIIKALKDKTLGATSLDVFEIEPLPKSSELWQLENCFITPHIAAISNPQTGVNYFSKIILDHEQGKPLRNVVDVSRGY